MSMLGKWSLPIGGMLVVIWLSMFAIGLHAYSGSMLAYTVFSLTFLSLLVSGFAYRQISYGYLFLVIFLWLGFWLKLSVHLIFPYPFVEFTGRFVGTSAAWDEVLIVATVAGFGVLGARYIYSKFGERSLSRETCATRVPSWYPAIRSWLWLLLVIGIFFVNFINVMYGIAQIGLVPRTILSWPLNAVISLMLVQGFAMCIATILWWDVLLGKTIAGGVYIVLLEGLISTVSLLSRGTVVFHVIPQLVAMYKNRKQLTGYSTYRALMVAAVFAVVLVLSYFAVNRLREADYSNVPLTFPLSSIVAQSPDAATQLSGAASQVNGLVKFSVDRWLGIEGVMAIASYPGKGIDLFQHALVEQSKNGKVDMYQEVCLSPYLHMDTSKFHFANLPGAVAFFYYTGSVGAVLLGMMFFTLLLLYGEQWIFTLTRNPVLCSFVGAASANIVAQFGVAPRQIIPYLTMLFGGILIIWLVQSEWFERGMRYLPFKVE